MGREGARFGVAHPNIVLYDTWRCSDSTWLAVAANNDRQFRTLCARIDKPGFVEDTRFATNVLKVEHRSVIDEILKQVFASKSGEDWLRILDGLGLAHRPINSIQRAFEHPQTLARNMVSTQPWKDVVGGEWKSIGVPVKFGESEAAVRRRPLRLGEETVGILAELGYAEHEIGRLQREGTV